MDRERDQHDVLAIKRIRAAALKQKISGDLPIFHERLRSCLTDVQSPSERDELLLRNRLLPASSSLIGP
jgi:hypothetical protein